VDQVFPVRTFRGELVPQDLDDESASVLLEPIRRERKEREAEKQPKANERRKRRAKTAR